MQVYEIYDAMYSVADIQGGKVPLLHTYSASDDDLACSIAENYCPDIKGISYRIYQKDSDGTLRLVRSSIETYEVYHGDASISYIYEGRAQCLASFEAANDVEAWQRVKDFPSLKGKEILLTKTNHTDWWQIPKPAESTGKGNLANASEIIGTLSRRWENGWHIEEEQTSTILHPRCLRLNELLDTQLCMQFEHGGMFKPGQKVRVLTIPNTGALEKIVTMGGNQILIAIQPIDDETNSQPSIADQITSLQKEIERITGENSLPDTGIIGALFQVTELTPYENSALKTAYSSDEMAKFLKGPLTDFLTNLSTIFKR